MDATTLLAAANAGAGAPPADVRMVLSTHELEHPGMLGNQLCNIVGTPEVQHVWLDLGRVTSITGSGLRLLIRLHKDLASHGQRLTLEHVRPEVYEVFHVTRPNVILDVRPA